MRRSMEIRNEKKVSFGSLEVSIRMKSKKLAKGNKLEQGSQNDINSEHSESISLEEEEFEDEEIEDIEDGMEDEPGTDRYNEQIVQEETFERIQRNIQHQNKEEGLEEGYIPNEQNEYV